MKSLVLLIGILLIIPILVLYGAFSWGYVALVIYNWFIVPVFPDVPVLTWMQLSGIMFFVNCFIHNSTVSYLKKEISDNNKGFTTNIVSPWLTLLVAWIFYVIIY